MMSTEKLRRAAPWIALSVLLLLPLYVLSTAFAIRSGVLDLGKRNITADEYKAMWAFFASGLATAATIIGLLLTKSHNDRTLAFQSEIENRKLLAGRGNR
jgi:predicted membrane-bound mannosyltransferase